MNNDERTPTPEEAFRSSLEDVVVLVGKLAPLCKSFKELVGMCELALTNDAQLRLLMNTVKASR